MDADEHLKAWLGSPLLDGVRRPIAATAGINEAMAHRLATGKTEKIKPATREKLVLAAQNRRNDLIAEMRLIDRVLEQRQ